ncbi:TRL-like family protein [Leptospira sp. 96542]|nr:TRL-like family protein [Leptospira sp. 96542]
MKNSKPNVNLKSKLLPVLCIIFFQCASSGFGSQGWLYENQSTSLMETGKPSQREAILCSRSYLGLVAFGDSSVSKTKEVGNIKEISSISLESFTILGVYAKLCTVVRGN